MNAGLAGFQSAFAAALFEPAAGPHRPLGGLTAQPAFAIYRNTVMKACVDALQANFPAVVRLVGSDWFRAAAALYVAAQPPKDARLLRYGDGFPDFLTTFEPARELPYLADVARLDRSWTQVHAEAEAATSLDVFASLSPGALGETCIAPHPAARWHWFADQPAYSIWSRNRSDCADAGDIPWQGEGALLTRQEGVVTWRAASPADCAFLDACIGGAPLVDAAAAALRREPDVDLAGLLAGLLGASALVLSPRSDDGATP